MTEEVKANIRENVHQLIEDGETSKSVILTTLVECAVIPDDGITEIEDASYQAYATGILDTLLGV